MVKKALGGLFLIAAVFLLVLYIFNGSLFSDRGTAAATYGYFLGKIISIVLYVFSGIFLLGFDSATKINYIDGFKKRSKQSSKIVVFITLYFIIFAVVTMRVSASDPENYLISWLVAVIPYGIPVIIFSSLMTMYSTPHKASKKYFINSDVALNEYLSESEVFYIIADDGSVVMSNKALFFPKLLCVVPFNQITSLKLSKTPFEKGIYFNLVNGKKFYVATKHFDCIQQAVSNSLL